ncbi:MAG: hypothetical protein ABEJ56_00585 [Candidatus Nanohaloarchaea archaeon]
MSEGSHQMPEFGHVFEVYDEDDEEETPPPGEGLREKIRKGEIRDLEELKEVNPEGYFLRPIMGDPYKTVKIKSGTQGTPIMFILSAADKFDDDWDWTSEKTEDKFFFSPRSNMHNEFTQRRQQAEQNVRQAMQGLEQLRKDKHMLQHDIRKLRSKAEDMRTGEETSIKGDFIELVDGAGGAGQQGGDEASLKFYRDQNFYPSIVADFNEMDSVENLEGDGPLADLPENEKAILKKKYTMYEKWKDLYGSEIQRKLEDLKKELRRVEAALEEQKQQIAPYVRDLVMINEKSQEDLAADITRYMTFEGYSTEFRQVEYICYQPFENEEGNLERVEDEDEATHYQVVYLHCVHVNITGGEEPRTPKEGPTVAKVYWFPAIVDKFVFERFFQQKIERKANKFENLMKDYTGSFENDEGEEFREKREAAGLPVRELRQKVGEKLDERPPLEFSSTIRRIEDGFESPSKIAEEYGEEYLEAVDELLDTSYAVEEEKGPETVSKFQKKLKVFTGKTDDYYMSDEQMSENFRDFTGKIKFNYYWDFKLNFGMYTTK